MQNRTISTEEVRHVAKLSQLRLSEEEVQFFSEQLSQVVDYIDKLKELDVDGIEPMAHPTGMTNRSREDRRGPTLTEEQALANAPEADPPFFKVPKVLDEGSGA